METKLLNVALSGYAPRDYSEKSNGDFIKYGEDNLFPNYLIELYNGSPTHRALCTTIAGMIYGEGFVPSDLESRLLYDKWNLEDELRKATLDLKIQGGMAFEINWSLDRETIANVSHLPFENIRCGEVNEETELTEQFYYSTDWSDRMIEPTCLTRFNPESRIDNPVQVLYVKPFSPGSASYPKPDYFGCLPYIELEPEIGTFHINNIRNGLMTSMAVHFANGIPPEEEQRAIKNQIQREAAGAGNAGNFWVTFSDDPDRKPSVDTFQLSDADKQYEFLSRECVDKIMIGHRVVSSAMFGVKTAGQLGNTQELEVAKQLFDEQVVSNFQRIVTGALYPLYDLSGARPIYEAITAPQEALKAIESPRVPEDVFEALNGEEMGEEWELIDEREVDYELESSLDALWTFASVPSSNPNGKSEQDTDIIKTRYKYAPSVSDNKSREFCSKMVSAGKVYRKEDIQAASSRGVNKGWGPGGADTYDLFLYKGGGSCRHYWMRQTYLRKDNKKISVNEARRIINALPASEREGRRLPVNDPKVAKRPRDMVNRGFLTPRNFTTPR